jgi:hypothetical protein
MLNYLRTAVAVTIIAATSAMHAQQPAAQGAIRTGTYELEIVFGGGTLAGSMELATSGDSLTVKMFVGDHQSPVKIGERKGNKLTLVSTSPAMSLRYELEFTGDAVKGTFVYDGAPGSVTGKLKKQ